MTLQKTEKRSFSNKNSYTILFYSYLWIYCNMKSTITIQLQLHFGLTIINEDYYYYNYTCNWLMSVMSVVDLTLYYWQYGE